MGVEQLKKAFSSVLLLVQDVATIHRAWSKKKSMGITGNGGDKTWDIMESQTMTMLVALICW